MTKINAVELKQCRKEIDEILVKQSSVNVDETGADIEELTPKTKVIAYDIIVYFKNGDIEHTTENDFPLNGKFSIGLGGVREESK
tara:strand:+ start:41 stop:295 length:255 start_codon:yes stop_codon:yes gene_type:complete